MELRKLLKITINNHLGFINNPSLPPWLIDWCGFKNSSRGASPLILVLETAPDPRFFINLRVSRNCADSHSHSHSLSLSHSHSHTPIHEGGGASEGARPPVWRRREAPPTFMDECVAVAEAVAVAGAVTEAVAVAEAEAVAEADQSIHDQSIHDPSTSRRAGGRRRAGGSGG